MPLLLFARRIVLGTTLAAAGIALLLARPDAALAHHIEVDDDASCAGWTVRAEYIGGDDDRLVVVDVWINGEHIDATFRFDADGLGHQDYFLLYERSGSGSLQTSGTIEMYEHGRRGYTRLVETDYTDIDLVCATPTPTRTATAVATATATPTATDTPVPTATPTPEDTVETGGSVTPLAKETPAHTSTPDTTTDSTITPLATESSTPSAQGSTTPLPMTTPFRSRNPRTPTSTSVVATPTFTDEVRGSTPTEQPAQPEVPSGNDDSTPETGTGFPDAGDGGMNGQSFVLAMLGFALVIVGIATIARGLGARK